MFFQLDTEGEARRRKQRRGQKLSAWSLGPLQGECSLQPKLSVSQFKWSNSSFIIHYSHLLQPSPVWVGAGEKENWRTSNIREGSRFFRIGLFDGPQVLTIQVKKELRKGHTVHKESNLPYHTLFYLEGSSGILKEHQFSQRADEWSRVLNLFSPPPSYT